jgi:hypothetical protein
MKILKLYSSTSLSHLKYQNKILISEYNIYLLYFNIKSWLLFSFGLKTPIFVKMRPQLPQKVSF